MLVRKEALVDERRDCLFVCVADHRSCIERESSGEHAEASKQHLLRHSQKLVAPVDGVSQRPLALRGVA